jgi:nitrate/TMAO reductase-like tetraheme cytochrome c subunit
VAAAVGAPLGWTVSDRLERDNDFCNACHLQPDVPLHLDIRRDFDAEPAASLAGLHGGLRLESRADAAFRCIDCHGGASALGRARVKALAAKDAFWYVTGRFEEPDGMAWPLWDEDCTQCHDRFDESASDPWSAPRFHELPVHNVELGVACVECHTSHVPGGNALAFFLDPQRVRSRCALCHSQFEE